MPAWSTRRIQSRARGRQVTRWYSVLAASMSATEPAKIEAPTDARPPSAPTIRSVPTTSATPSPISCSTPRSMGRTSGGSRG